MPTPTNTPKPEIRVSVSQIKKYKRCPKAWWYEYGPLQDKSPSKPAAALGTKVHEILESYLLTGANPPDNKAGRIASCGLDKLPDPAGLDIERSITIPLTNQANILCRIDMVGTDRPYIGDHKTTSDFKWAKTCGELENDVQLLTYAYAAYFEEKPETVDAELIYYRTRGLPVSMSVATSLPWEAIEKNWEAIGEIAEEMAPKKIDPTGESCAGNSSACGDYGGCYHAPKCPFSPKNQTTPPKNLAEVFRRDNIEAGAVASPKQNPKKETQKMNDKTQDIQKAFGILSPDAPPETEQTQALLADTAKKLRAMLELMGGDIPPDTVVAFLSRAGISEENRAEVVKRATASGEKTKFQPTRKPPCNDTVIREHAGELHQKVIRTEGGIAEETVKAWFADKISPNKITSSRWNRLVEYSGLLLDGCWFHAPETNGYTKDPETTEDTPPETTEDTPPETGADLDRAAYEAKTGKKARGVVNMLNALTSPLVVLVDARFNQTPQNAQQFDSWVLPYIETLEKREQKDFYALDADYGRGPKLLAGIVASAFHKNPPAGLIVMDSTHPCANQMLPLLVRAGAVVIYGR